MIQDKPLVTFLIVLVAGVFLLSFSLFNTSAAGISQTSMGSGFIVHPRGYILTNYHVVKEAQEITARLDDDKIFEAELIDYSPTLEEGGHDLALLRIKTGRSEFKTHHLPLGDSDKVDLYEEVIVLGYPLPLEFGTQLNATGGNITSFRKYKEMDLFQIDAAINRGNSGGPLLNSRGMVVGITTLKVQRTGSGANSEIVQGGNFAIPINYARTMMEDIPDSDFSLTDPEVRTEKDSKKIVKDAKRAVVFIKAETKIPLSSLLPQEISDYEKVELKTISTDGLEERGFGVEEAVATWGTRDDWEAGMVAILFDDPEQAKRSCERGMITVERDLRFDISDFDPSDLEKSKSNFPYFDTPLPDHLQHLQTPKEPKREQYPKLELGWVPSREVKKEWNRIRTRTSEGENLYHSIRLCASYDPEGYRDCMSLALQTELTDTRNRKVNVLWARFLEFPGQDDIEYHKPSSSSADFEAISCLPVGRLIILTKLSWGVYESTSMWEPSLRYRYDLKNDTVVKYFRYGKVENDVLKFEEKDEGTVMTVDKLLSEYRRINNFVYRSLSY